MEIIESHLLKVFRKDYEGRTYYKVGISKKDQNGNYVNGYLDVRFKKDVELEDRTNIYIKKAWIDFYLKDKKTIPYIFISEFETVDQTIDRIHKENSEEQKTDPYEEMGKQVQAEQYEITEDMLPF
jgi:hypothetical protein